MAIRLRHVLVSLLLAGGTLACAGSPTPGPAPRPEDERSTTDATPTPTSVPDAASPAPPRLKLVVVGDIMLGRGVAAANADPASTLRHFRPMLRRADFAVGNLESTLSRRGAPRQPGDDSFAADPGVLAGLVDAGLDAVSLANNHVGDYGVTALVDTVAALERSRLVAFGAGRDLEEAARPAILEQDGVRVGFLGFNAIGETPEAAPGGPGALSVSMPPRTGPLDREELRRVLRAVRRLSRRVDVTVVMPHWGQQYTRQPGPVQTMVGRRLVDAGADLVVGGHPHWVQRVDRHRGAVIAHSLGNFVFDMDFMPETMEGVVLTATLEGPRIVEVDYVPYRMDSTFTPRRVRGATARRVLAGLGSRR